MRFSRTALVTLLALPLLAFTSMAGATSWWPWGAKTPVPIAATPQPTPDMTPLSYPPVTPDPTFTNAAYAYKWPHITLIECQRLMKEHGTVLVDGRSMSEWQQSHLPGALPMPLGDFDKNYSTYQHQLKRAKIIIAYCHGKGCRLSDAVAQRLVDKGYKNVAVFWGGFPEWTAAHLPLYDKYRRKVKD
ncbi:MAG: rhodanese-like domain-containing protein [bacterium]